VILSKRVTFTEIVEEEDATVDIGEVIAWVEVDE
jgi:hypothetical protein